MRVLRPGSLVGVILGAVMLAACGPGTVAVIALALSTADSGDSDGGGAPVPCDALTGTLDAALAGTGLIVLSDTAGGGGDDRGYGIVVDSFGRILVCGESRGAVSGNPDMMIWRFTEGGLPDAAFNGQGWVAHDGAAGGSSTERADGGIALDPWGRIVVAGRSFFNGLDVVIWRYNVDGTLDSTFNGQGWVVRDNIAGGGGLQWARDLALDSSGRVLVTGMSQGPLGNYDMFILRYDLDGTPDLTFGSGGFLIHRDAAGQGGMDDGRAIALDASGRILVAGASQAEPMNRNNMEMTIWRFDSYGILDGSFGVDGVVIHPDTGGGLNADMGEEVRLDASGRIVVAGWFSDPTGDPDLAVWRYQEDGTPDRTFGGRGFIVLDGLAGGREDYGLDLAIDCAGGILIAGSGATLGFEQDMILLRMDSAGTFDPGFGTGGVIVHGSAAGGGGDDRGLAMALDDAGRILVTGFSENSTGQDEMVVWRYR